MAKKSSDILKVSGTYDTSPWTPNVATLCRYIDEGKVKFDNPVQRGEVWEIMRKSLLINQILIQAPIDPIKVNYFPKTEMTPEVYDVIDGKQRILTTIYRFIEGKYKLHPDTPSIIEGVGDDQKVVKIGGCYFNQLPPEYQNTIKETTIIAWKYNAISEEQIKDQFFRINNGKSLTALEQNRAKVLNLDLHQSVGMHKTIQMALTEKSILKAKDEAIAMHIWILCYNESPCLLANYINKTSAVTAITKEQVDGITAALDYVEKLYENVGSNKELYRKIKGQSNLEMLAYMAFMAIEKNISVADFIEKASSFFTTEEYTNEEGKIIKPTTISAAYNEAAKSGTGKAVEVGIRMEEIVKYLVS